jgi:predicted RND superfamily exporter protein
VLEATAASGSLDRRGRLPRRLVAFGLDHPVAVLLVWLLLGVLATPWVLRLEVETSTNSVLDRSGADWAYYEAAQERFGGDEVLTLLLEADEPYAPALLADVRRLSDDFAGIPGVARVDSLRTVPNVRSSPGGTLSLEPALSGDAAPDRAAADSLAARVEADRIAPRILISDDARALGVNLVLEKDADALYEEILASVDAAVGDRQAWISGVPVFRVAADARTRSELLTFVPLTVLLVGSLLFFLFRSVRAAAIPLATTGVASWLVMAAMGAQGIPITITTVMLPSVLLALGCAYSMHLVNAAATSEREDLRAALLAVALPVMLSGLTTAVGLVAVSTVRIDAIRQIGTFGALGVLVVLLSTLTAGPAALRLWPVPRRSPRLTETLCERVPGRIVSFINRRGTAVLAAWLIAFAVSLAGMLRLNVETDVIVWFQRSDPIRLAYEEIRSRLVGISPMNVVVEAPPEGRVSEPRVVDAVDRLAAHLEELESVGRSLSITDPLRQIHGGFTGDARQPLPDDQSLIEQYLLLLEAKEYTHDLITADRSAANVVLRVNDNGSRALLDIAAAADVWWRENGVQGYEARTTGIMYEFARAEDEIAWGQIRGLGLALLAITTILLLMFRWPRLAALALIPNAIPIAMAFGFMGLIGYPIDAATVILGNLALGIAVDDTIHVAEGFARRTASGATAEKALLETLRSVVAPLAYTTFAVALGFAVLGVSGFSPVRNLGIITGGVMVVCLLADLLLLPALLIRTPPRR